MHYFLKNIVFLATLVLSAATAYAEKPLLRISCDENDTNVKIMINGVYKGDCPIDISVDPGNVMLHAQQPVSAEMERVFIQKFFISDGVYRRIDVVLSAPQLTVAAYKARQAEADKKEQKAAQQELQAAQNGDMQAMLRISKRYQDGKGLSKDPAQAELWQKKYQEAHEATELKSLMQRAEAGNSAAMFDLAKRYENGNGVPQDTEKSQAWQQKAQAAETQKRLKEKQEAEARRRAKVEERLKSYSMTPNMDKLTKSQSGKSDPFDALSSTVASPMALVSDMLSSPSHSAERSKIADELTPHAAAWAEPDSLMAKVHTKRQLITAETK
ncbi:MAG: hypothetical protein LWW87_07620 [Geobacteraceae bacterium]|nr:hypothetical protein [Geobacteraceae bacterium]